MYIFKLKFVKIVYRVLAIFICAVWLFFIGLYLLSCFERTFLYPLKYKDEISFYSDVYGLDRRLVFAVVNVESGFDANAESKKGAKGLMQITTATGEYISQFLGKKQYDLFDVNDNLNYGCFYIKYLFSKFKLTKTVISAYNAGEGNVYQWLDNPKYSSDGVTLDKIPFKETEEYVKKFNRSFEKYDKLYPHILDK